VFKHKETQYQSLATLHPRQTFTLLADALRVLPKSNTGTHGHRTGTRPGPHQEVSVDCCRIEYRLLRLGLAWPQPGPKYRISSVSQQVSGCLQWMPVITH